MLLFTSDTQMFAQKRRDKSSRAFTLGFYRGTMPFQRCFRQSQSCGRRTFCSSEFSSVCSLPLCSLPL